MNNSASAQEATGATALEVVDLSSGYAGQVILHNVSASFQSGVVTALIGPNGAGKSTLLKTIFGLCRIQSGTIYLHGQPVSGSAEDLVRRGVAYVPQVKNVFPTLSVRENLEIGTYVRSADSLSRALDLFPDLKAVLKKRAGQLSGGQQNMLAVGRALMSNPTVLLVDEASGGLAPLAAQGLWRQLVESSRTGVAVIAVEQNVSLALEHAQKVYLLTSGRNRYEGTPKELTARGDFESLFFDAKTS